MMERPLGMKIVFCVLSWMLLASCPIASQPTKLGIKTSGQALKHMLGKIGYNVNKVQAMEKLDLLELIRDQLQKSLESRKKTQLKLEVLTSFLRFEGMTLDVGNARDAILELEKLRIRERKRLGKYTSSQDFEAYENALSLIPDSEVRDVFDDFQATWEHEHRVDVEDVPLNAEMSSLLKADEMVNEELATCLLEMLQHPDDDETSPDKKRLQATAETDRILAARSASDILGPGPASKQQREFRRIALLLHPDKGIVSAEDQRGQVAFKLVLAARRRVFAGRHY